MAVAKCVRLMILMIIDLSRSPGFQSGTRIFLGRGLPVYREDTRFQRALYVHKDRKEVAYRNR